jgi:hypothetical protein
MHYTSTVPHASTIPPSIFIVSVNTVGCICINSIGEFIIPAETELLSTMSV